MKNVIIKSCALVSSILFSCMNINAMKGTGSLEDPYLIENKEDFKTYFSAKSIDSHAKLMNDIVLNENVLDENYQLNEGTYEQWNSQCELHATFDGQNHSVSGLYMYTNSTSNYSKSHYWGLFTEIAEDGTVKNLTLKDAYLNCADTDPSSNHLGGICAHNSGTIKNCHFDGYIFDKYIDEFDTNDRSYVGGICAKMTGGSISGCSAKGSLNGLNRTGGIIGFYEGTAPITNCTNYAHIYGKREAGGIVGATDMSNEVNINQCDNHGVVESDHNAGGVVAWAKASVSNCKNLGTVRGQDYTGGIAGYIYNAIDNCVNEGDVTNLYTEKNAFYTTAGVVGSCKTVTECVNKGNVSSLTKCGGVAGICKDITKCHNEGIVTGEDNIGGVAYSTEQISDCYNIGTVKATGGNIAGVCANVSSSTINAQIIHCYNNGTVSGNNHVAGIVGTASGTVTQCFNTGDITATDNNAAGIIAGNVSLKISFCYNTGTITGASNVCGLNAAGGAYKCYNLGQVIGEENVRPIAPDNTMQMNSSNCYYNKEKCILEKDYAGALTTEQILDIQHLMPLLDTDVWYMYEDQEDKAYYPNLRYYKGIIDGPVEKDITFDENGFCKEYKFIYQPAPITEDGVVEISNGGQLMWYMEKVNFDEQKSLSAVLLEDVTINADMDQFDFEKIVDTTYAITKGFYRWVPLGTIKNGLEWNHFSGTFDGQDHTINGLICNGLYLQQGKFIPGIHYPEIGFVGYLEEDGVIKNLKINNSYFQGNEKEQHQPIGALCAENHGLISRCSVDNTRIASGNLLGGICSQNYGTIKNSGTNKGCFIHDIDGILALAEIGGLVHTNHGTGILSECNSNGVIKSKNGVGGIVYDNYGLLSYCKNFAEINATSNVGGICCNNNVTYEGTIGKLNHCVNFSSKLASERYSVAGVCCFNKNYNDIYAEIGNCNNLGFIEGKEIAGICWENNGMVKGCLNYGDLTSTEGPVGGIVSNNYRTVKTSLNHGNITSKKDYVGGIVGKCNSFFNDINISLCVNNGVIIGNKNVGGIVGFGDYVKETEKGTNVNNCINTSTIAGNDNVGGICGNSFITEKCFAYGPVKGLGTFVGCIIGHGYANGFLRHCYVNLDSCITKLDVIINPNNPIIDLPGVYDITYVKSSDAQGSGVKSSMGNLDFDNTWVAAENGYPTLKAFKNLEDGGFIEDVDKSESDADPVIENDGVLIYTNEGTAYVISPSAFSAYLYNINGLILKEVTITEGVNSISGLHRGVYFLGNRKFIIK